MIHVDRIVSLEEAPGAAPSRTRRRLPLRLVEVHDVPAPPVPTPLPGHLCELCLDAPAVVVVPAPWGGDIGVCDPCRQASAVVALPVLTAVAGEQTLWHPIHDPARLAAYRAAATAPLPSWWDRCISTAPARVCPCGSYQLRWSADEAT